MTRDQEPMTQAEKDHYEYTLGQAGIQTGGLYNTAGLQDRPKNSTKRKEHATKERKPDKTAHRQSNNDEDFRNGLSIITFLGVSGWSLFGLQSDLLTSAILGAVAAGISYKAYELIRILIGIALIGGIFYATFQM